MSDSWRKTARAILDGTEEQRLAELEAEAADPIERYLTLEGEIADIERVLSDRAAEFYRAQSGRRAFHRLQVTHVDDTHVHFVTPIRDGEIAVEVPREFFR